MDLEHAKGLVDSSTHLTNEFFGYLLVAQMSTIETMGRLEIDVDSSKEKTNKLQESVNHLMNKCVLLEDTIASLQKLLITRVETESQVKVSPLEPSSFDFENQRVEADSTDFMRTDKRELLTPEKSPLKSLADVCSNVYLLEGFDEDKKPPKKSEKSTVDHKWSKSSSGCKFCSSPSREYSGLRRRLCLESCGDKRAELNDDEKREIQRMFNKRVKYEVNRKFGRRYLIKHQVRELDVDKMHRIKKKVLRVFAPFPLPIKAAWSNAMNSLRQDRHQLKKRARLHKKTKKN